MTTTATETERHLQDTNRFRLDTIADHNRSQRNRDYLFAGGALVAAAFVIALSLSVIL